MLKIFIKMCRNNLQNSFSKLNFKKRKHSATDLTCYQKEKFNEFILFSQ